MCIPTSVGGLGEEGCIRCTHITLSNRYRSVRSDKGNGQSRELENMLISEEGRRVEIWRRGGEERKGGKKGLRMLKKKGEDIKGLRI